MSKRNRMPGLRLKGGVWQIEKRTKHTRSGWLRESTGATERAAAEQYLIRRLAELEQQAQRARVGIHTFEEAGLRYLEEVADQSSADDIAMHLDQLFPFIGHLTLESVHDGTLREFIAHEMSRQVRGKRTAGLSPKSINNALGVVSAVLNRAAKSWRSHNGQPWITQAPPKITQVPVKGNRRRAYPLSWHDQHTLLKVLPDHLRDMTLFKVNTGCREQEVCQLRWEWEIPVPELRTSVFVIPAYQGDTQLVKNGEDRLVVLNRVAMGVVESRRHKHDTFVFTWTKGKKLPVELPVTKMNNSAWKRAWRSAGLPTGPEVSKGVHNLKHTFGRRLRAVGCPLETRKVLLGHKDGDITTHYSPAEIGELLRWLNKAADPNACATPVLNTLRRRHQRHLVGKVSEPQTKRA